MTSIQKISSSILSGVLVGALSITACSNPDDPQAGANAAPVTNSQARLVRVETQQLSPTHFKDVIELTGSVEANNDATLSAQTAGTIEFLMPLGSVVPAGNIVARINAGLTDAAVEQAEAQVASARAQLNLARDSYERQEPLFRDSVISALEFENVRTQLNQAEAQLQQAEGLRRQAREQSQYTRLTAPFPGRIERHFVEVGEQAAPGVPVVRIVNTNKVKITTGVPERYAGDIRDGSTAEVRFNTYGIDPVSGVVSFADSAIDRASRTFPIEVQLDNRDGRLKPEMVGKILLTRASLEDVIVVPLDAILRDENGTNVFIAADKDGFRVASRRSVTVGPTYGGHAVILDGLSAGDELIVAGQNLLTPGDRMEILSSDEKSVDAAPVQTAADTLTSR